MSSHHFTVDERKSILIYHMQGLNFSQIAKLLHRHPSSISREWKRHPKDYVENRGKIPISHTIHKRPEEADTVAGKTGKAYLVTLTDRYSRFLKIKKVAVKKSKLVIEAMVKMLEPLTKHTLTPDRGKEFTYHQKLSDQLKIEVYFPDPHAPWQRGTNENTNGLLREYFPQGRDLTVVDDQIIQLWENKLNNRTRKCLNWKTPYEVFYEENVHLI